MSTKQKQVIAAEGVVRTEPVAGDGEAAVGVRARGEARGEAQ